MRLNMMFRVTFKGDSCICMQCVWTAWKGFTRSSASSASHGGMAAGTSWAPCTPTTSWLPLPAVRPVWIASIVASLWSTYGSGCSTFLSTAMSSSVHTVGTWTTISWSHSPPSKFSKLIDESFALVIAILLILLLYYISFIGEHSVTLISFLIWSRVYFVYLCH